MISVIVPIYKVEQYLRRCIESILGQTYPDFELILVNDGSPDCCCAICEEYADKDKRIRFISKQNGGLSDARNAGLKVARGEYVSFVDSDDWIASTYLERLLECLQKTDSDICECEIMRTAEAVNAPENNFKMKSYETQESLRLLIQDCTFHQYVWNKLYKRECLNGIFFEVGKTNEDEFWTYQVFGNAKRITKISDVLYFYFQREDSIMGGEYNLKRLDALEAKQCRLRYIEQRFPELTVYAKINLIESCIYAGQMSLIYLQGEKRKKARRIITSVEKTIDLKQNEWKMIAVNRRIWLLLSKQSFWMTCRFKNLLKKGF